MFGCKMLLWTQVEGICYVYCVNLSKYQKKSLNFEIKLGVRLSLRDFGLMLPSHRNWKYFLFHNLFNSIVKMFLYFKIFTFSKYSLHTVTEVNEVFLKYTFVVSLSKCFQKFLVFIFILILEFHTCSRVVSAWYYLL